MKPFVAIGSLVVASGCSSHSAPATTVFEDPPQVSAHSHLTSIVRGPFFTCVTSATPYRDSLATCSGHSTAGDMPWSPVNQQNLLTTRRVSRGAKFVQGEDVVCLFEPEFSTAECWSGAWGDRDAVDDSSPSSSTVIRLSSRERTLQLGQAMLVRTEGYPAEHIPCVSAIASENIRVVCADNLVGPSFRMGDRRRGATGLVTQAGHKTLCGVTSGELSCVEVHSSSVGNVAMPSRRLSDREVSGIVGFSGRVAAIDIGAAGFAFVDVSGRGQHTECSHESVRDAVLFARSDTVLVWLTRFGVVCGAQAGSCEVSCIDQSVRLREAAAAFDSGNVFFGVGGGDECLLVEGKTACWSLNEGLSRATLGEPVDLSKTFRNVRAVLAGWQ